MPVVTEHMKWRRPRNQFRNPISETDDPITQIPSIIQSSHSKSTISSLLSSFSTSGETTHARDQNRTNNNNKSNRKFSAATFRGFGCTAGSSQKVSVPAVIRSSADWEGKRNRKKNHRRKSNSNGNSGNNTCDDDDVSGGTFVDFQDVSCGPGIGFSTDAASVECAVARKNVSSRGKLDVVEERVTHRERSSYFGRRTVKPESFSFLDDEPDIFAARPGLEPFGTARFYRHVPHPSPDGLAEQLLELGERIGYVNTGLKEDEMGLNIRKVKPSSSNDTSKHQLDKKCSVCQEEYESDDELGRLKCDHSYHFQCIKHWLEHKNFCPVCKQEVVVRH
ncbi:E3 ubiquitin-protein ligase MBR1 [Glycine soja]